MTLLVARSSRSIRHRADDALIEAAARRIEASKVITAKCKAQVSHVIIGSWPLVHAFTRKQVHETVRGFERPTYIRRQPATHRSRCPAGWLKRNPPRSLPRLQQEAPTPDDRAYGDIRFPESHGTPRKAGILHSSGSGGGPYFRNAPESGV